MMGTLVKVRVFTEDSVKAYADMEAAFKEMERVSALLSNYNPTSEVSRLNACAGWGEMRVSQDLLKVLKSSVKFSQITDGAFDVTIRPVLDLWGFSEDEPTVPSREEIESRLKLVGYENISIGPNGQVELTLEGMSIDLGGVAKGYGVDQAIEVLKSRGATRAIVDAGGDVRVLGPNPNGDRWHIGIRHPREKDGVIAVVEVDSGSVATSGDYERFFEKDGVRYHHLLNPKTGMPARESVSATVLANSAMDADILSTAAFVLGPDKGVELLNSLSGVEGVIFFEKDGGLVRAISDGLKGRVKFK